MSKFLVESQPEEDQRQSGKKHRDLPTWTPTREEAARIAEIRKWQQDNGISDARLCEFCSVNSVTWFHVHKGTYKGNGSNVLTKVSEGWRRCKEVMAAKSKNKVHPFYITPEFEDLNEAVQLAHSHAEDGREDRLVTVLGRYGMGKTAFGRQLIDQRREGVLIHAHVDWRGGVKSMMQDVAQALGLSEDGTIRNLRTSIFAELNAKRQTVYVHELSPHNINRPIIEFLRALINETKVVLVMFAVPEFYEEILRIGGETARQLMRRGRIIRIEEVLPQTALSILKEEFSEGRTVEAAATQLARHASTFGGAHLVRCVVEELAVELDADSALLTAERIDAKVGVFRSFWEPKLAPNSKRRAA